MSRRRLRAPIAIWSTRRRASCSFFRTATPITEIADLNVGSRPASRKKSDRIEDLRAIPWVFSWSLSRIMLPGWYGFGTAVEALVGKRGGARAGSCCATCTATGRSSARCCPTWTWCWPRATSASHRATPSWCRDAELRERIFGRIQAEMAAHGDATCWRSPARTSCWRSNPALARSFRNRSPYIDPLNHLQVESLRRFRAGENQERHGEARDPADDQRHRRGPAQQRLDTSHS